MRSLVPLEEVIEKKILLIKGQNVMLDSDLAACYGVTTSGVKGSLVHGLGSLTHDTAMS
jgi:hypothetical protein